MKQLIGLTMLLGSSTLQAQSLDAALRQKMEYHLRQASEKYDIPNVEVLIIKDDTVFYHQSIGEHVSAHTPYYLGSVSKSLTALGLLKLIDLGKASLDDKLTDILPEIKLTQYAEEVTLRTLLNHTSGIAKRDGFQPVPKLNELAGWTVAINERPGLKREYSNLNYVLIGWVLEQIAGQSLDNYMRMHVFEPLKMQHTYACKKEIASQKVITQYQYFYGIPIKSSQVDYADAAIPAGFMISTAEDMGNYIRLSLNGGIFQDHILLSSQWIATMQTPWNGQDQGYGMGWKAGTWHNKRMFQHLGSTATSYAGLFLIPEDKLGFIVLTNSNTLWAAEDMIKGILNLLTGNEPALTSKEQLFRMGLGVLTLSFLLYYVYKTVAYWKKRNQKPRKRIVISLMVSLAMLASIVFAFPLVAGLPFGSLLSIQPDIGTSVLLFFGLPVIYQSILLVTPHKSVGG